MRHHVSRLAAAAILAVAAAAQARPIPAVTLLDLAKQADILLVGEVRNVEDAGEGQSDTWHMPVVHKRATLRILRGIKTSDASALDLGEIVVNYDGVKNGIPPDGPMFPHLTTGQIAVFPLKQNADKSWRFVAEEDTAMIVPAAAREITAGWPADMPGSVAFLHRELAGAFLYGDFPTMASAGRYLDALSPAINQPADTVFALIKAEIGENLLREDARWVTITAASYISGGIPRPTFGDLLNGKLPERPSLRLAALTLSKAGKFQLGQRLMMTLINHQEDPGMAWGVATGLLDNFADDPSMIAMELQTIRSGKPGAMTIADYLIKDRKHPFAAAAAEAARNALSYGGAAHDIPDALPYADLTRLSVNLLLRAGTDDDFAFLLDQVQRARPGDPKVDAAKVGEPKLYQAFIQLAGDSELSPQARVLELCRLYIDDPTPMAPAPFPGFRLCDMAAMTAERVGMQHFNFKHDDPVDKRDAAIAEAAAWLKTNK